MDRLMLNSHRGKRNLLWLTVLERKLGSVVSSIVFFSFHATLGKRKQPMRNI